MSRRDFGSVRARKTARATWFQARYVGPDGIRRTLPTKFVRRADATKALAEVQTEISNGSWTDPGAVAVDESFAAYAATWLGLRELKPKTASEYRGLLRRRLNPEFGEQHLSEITVAQVNRWFASLAAHPTDRANAYGLLNTICKTAVTEGLIPSSPCQVRKGGVKKVAKHVDVLDDNEVAALADAIGSRYRAMVLLAAYLCLRFGEMAELRRKDFHDHQLDVHRGVTWIKDETTGAYVEVVGDPKSEAGSRTIELPAFIEGILHAHLAEFAQPGPDGLIFPPVEDAEDGHHMKHAALYKVFRVARRKIGRPSFQWHDLRHTAATFYAQEDATLKELMTLLGHATPTMALHYQHVGKGRMRNLADRMDNRVVLLADAS